MSDKDKPKPDFYGLVFVALLMVIILLITLISSGGGQSQTTGPANPRANIQPATPIPAPGTPSFGCEPGIEVGKTISVVHAAVRMRKSSGYVDKDDNKDSIHYLKTGDQVVVKDGPQIKDGLCWWLVAHEGSQGWMADHSRDGSRLLSAGP